MLTVYSFDDKYAADTDGFTFNLTAWLGTADTIAGTPTATVTPNDAIVDTIAVSGAFVTVWINGGTATTNYTISLTVLTVNGRDCQIRGTFLVEA